MCSISQIWGTQNISDHSTNLQKTPYPTTEQIYGKLPFRLRKLEKIFWKPALRDDPIPCETEQRYPSIREKTLLRLVISRPRNCSAWVSSKFLPFLEDQIDKWQDPTFYSLFYQQQPTPNSVDEHLSISDEYISLWWRQRFYHQIMS